MSTTPASPMVSSPDVTDAPPPEEGAASLEQVICLASTPEQEGAPFELVDYLVLVLACLLFPAVCVLVAWLA